MSTDKIETDRNTAVAADRQMIERTSNSVPAPAATATVRPWTADFLLPSISFHRSERP
jgi:hypothetical protein